MLNKEDIDFFKKIEAGLKLAMYRLYEQKAAQNATVVISVDGKVKHVPAKDLLINYKSA